MVSEVQVRSDEHCETGAFCGFQKLAILQCRPTQLVCGGHFMVRQRLPERDWRALIEQDAHSGGRQCAPRGVRQDGTNLFCGYAGEPLHELGYLSSVL